MKIYSLLLVLLLSMAFAGQYADCAKACKARRECGWAGKKVTRYCDINPPPSSCMQYCLLGKDELGHTRKHYRNVRSSCTIQVVSGGIPGKVLYKRSRYIYPCESAALSWGDKAMTKAREWATCARDCHYKTGKGRTERHHVDEKCLVYCTSLISQTNIAGNGVDQYISLARAHFSGCKLAEATTGESILDCMDRQW